MDPRVARTRSLLQEALLELARERELDAISVADLADRATVNRSTFYQHYPDKETLLADALDAQAALVGADLSDIDPGALTDAPPEVIVRYTRHLAENAALYRQVFGEPGSPLVTARLRGRIRAMARQACEEFGLDEGDRGVPTEIVAASIAGSLVEMLSAWLEMEPLPPPEQAARWAWRALAGH